MTIQRFRWLIIGCVLSAVAALVATFVLEFTLPHALQTYLADSLEQDLSYGDIVLLLITIPAVVAMVWCTISMYCLRPFARTFAMWVTIVCLPIYPICGPTVATGWQDLFSSISEMLWGAILMAMYLPPLRERFDRAENKSAT
jgi:hypothetical protein